MPINDVQNAICADCGDTRTMFNNVVGTAYFGGKIFIAAQNISLSYVEKKIIKHTTISKGTPVVLYARHYPVGLHEGSGDEIGWTSIKITEDMVGKTVAVFTSIERKTVNDTMKPEQEKWFRRVKEAGGIAEIYKEMPSGAIERIREIL